ncbi:MAG: ATP-binding protein [Nitrososphaera sp.]
MIDVTSRPASTKEAIRILTQPAKIKHQYLSLISAATKEILVVFPTANAVRREEKIGVIDELRKAKERGVIIRILTPEDDFIRHKLDKLKDAGISVQRIETPSEAKFKLLIVDRKISLGVETADDSKSEFFEAVGVATLSSNKPTVLPYVTIFESFWKETELYEKAAQADKIKDDFVNIAAHELRNPITPIISAIEFVNRDFAKISEVIRNHGDDQAKKKLENIRMNLDMIGRNTIKLMQLAEDILQVSRIQSGTFALNMQRSSINAIIDTTIQDIRKKYEDAKPRVKIVFTCSPALAAATKIEIYCDAAKVTQVLFNMLDNAMRFTNEEGTVEVTLDSDEEELVFSIIDSGPGIDPAIANRLFEKFAAKSNGGTGLGLYLCKKIIDAHGGRIWAQNNTGKAGATFTFTLPVDLSPEQVVATTNAASEPERTPLPS